MKNINKTIIIKYGNENNDYVNRTSILLGYYVQYK